MGKRAVERRERAYAEGDQDITHEALGEAYRWTCAICGKPVERYDASIDHVIPLWAGGPHLWANVQLAHSWCNSRRSCMLDHRVLHLLSQPVGKRGRRTYDRWVLEYQPR